ncbi:hypothetical protein DTO166G4_8714 [Paecilomyces variotii]|nr:hypothetical protein DTO164E3_2043 [Paecilomyces variotii]KAJ9208893.1 hypothetical protein DTO032I3_110 [Paecilomyces variotii]KAJ9209670.1 hypothetical protein DTO166G4_8714 [Paecilomyces variotii]KAJ9218584.1 hypothetical protein DTO169C6_9080 [Paecilomyces variotii]KAJ9228537.1 hypothetical protein DTO166G5_8510 [Paecilomyces variotii]
MQGLWSRAASSQSACRCVSCLSTAANGISSRAATAASRRRLRIGNSVTALYSSIFAAAALADARVKDKRRHEWEEKIAAVKEEVNELVDEEKRILEALSSRKRNGQFSRQMQVRQYSTAAGFRTNIESPRPEKYTQERQFDKFEESLPSQTTEAAVPPEPEAEETLFDEDGEEENDIFTSFETPWTAGDPLRTKAIQKLALRQLAIRLLLRPVVAPNYSGLPLDYPTDSALPKLNVTELMAQLRMTQNRIYALRYREDEAFDDLAKDMHIRAFNELRSERCKLDEILRDDINLYLSNRMPLPELLVRISDNLMASKEPDRPRAFQVMIMAFTKTRKNDLVDLVLRTMLPNQFELNPSVIVSVLTYFRKSKDLKNFDLFLEMLMGQGYPANIPPSARWKSKVINGIEIVVPPVAASNPVMYGTLIAAALRFDQPDRAEAWMQAWRAAGFTDDFSTLCSFLRFYTIRKNWEKGRHVLKRAVAFMLSSTSHPPRRIERLIVHMVHFCDSCAQEDVSATLIAAAVRSGFDWNAARRQHDISADFDPAFQRWRNADAEISREPFQHRNIAEKCSSFAALVEDEINEACQSGEKRNAVDGKRAPSVNVPSAEVMVSSIPTTSSEELHALREEITRLKTMVSQLYQNEQASQAPHETPEKLAFSPTQPGAHLAEQASIPRRTAYTPGSGHIKDVTPRPHVREEGRKRMVVRTILSGPGAN